MAEPDPSYPDLRDQGPAPREPVFNLPRSIVIFAALIIGIHIARAFSPVEADIRFLLTFAFIPARFTDIAPAEIVFPGGLAGDIWTFVTYAFIHGDTLHLGVNLLWLLAFGSPMAWRFGPLRFWAFSVVCAAAGAVAHLASYPGEFAPMVGASAVISGHMAGAIRFVFQAGGPLGVFRYKGRRAFMTPALSLAAAFSNAQVLLFVGIWMAINLIFGLGRVPLDDGGASIAWQAHIGGFLAGLLLFGLFDPVGRSGSSGGDLPPDAGNDRL